MSNYFLESSALVKRYHVEEGSEKINAIIDKEQYIMISSVGIIEICSTLNRKKNQGKITEENLDFVKAQFFHDVNKRFFVVGLEGYRIAIANEMVFRHNLTSFDAIQLASCIDVGISGKIVFVSADGHLVDAAKEEGIETVNPLSG